MTTKLADRIREYAFTHYIKPARDAGKSEIKIRLADVHREMGLRARMPSVYGALATQVFEQECSVKRLEIIGLNLDENTMFIFAI
jgi:hypothetical protein